MPHASAAPVSVPAHLMLGKAGEHVAAAYLLAPGYEVPATGVRLGPDEIDIIAFDPADNVLVFAEVKTRTGIREGFHPELTASWRKRVKLRRSARRWVAQHEYDGAYRIDLLCVVHGKVAEHYKELSWE